MNTHHLWIMLNLWFQDEWHVDEMSEVQPLLEAGLISADGSYEHGIDIFLTDRGRSLIEVMLDAGLLGRAPNSEEVETALTLVFENAPDINEIHKWSPLRRSEAHEWATREHLYASDNEDVCRLPKPKFLDDEDVCKLPKPRFLKKFSYLSREMIKQVAEDEKNFLARQSLLKCSQLLTELLVLQGSTVSDITQQGRGVDCSQIAPITGALWGLIEYMCEQGLLEDVHGLVRGSNNMLKQLRGEEL